MSKRFLKNISSSISFFTGSLVAIAVCSVATVARAIPQAPTTGYPVVSSSEAGSLYCYLTTSDNTTLNLNRLCGEVSAGSSTAGYGATSTYGGYSSGSYGGSGNCQYSWQLDSAGRACGGRAANIRPGGNNGGYSPSYNSGYGGSSGGRTYVRPYTRSDGTSVRGHYRSK